MIQYRQRYISSRKWYQFIILLTQSILSVNIFWLFDSNSVNSPHFCQLFCQLTTSTIISADIFLFHHSWITSLKAKIRDYPSGLEPDLKSRKAFIYLSYYTLTYPPLTSIPPSQRAPSTETCLQAERLAA